MDDGEAEGNPTENQEFLARLGRRLKTLRLNRGLSQEQVAEAADLMQHYISQIERGERNVSILTLRLLARALEESLSGLLEGIE